MYNTDNYLDKVLSDTNMFDNFTETLRTSTDFNDFSDKFNELFDSLENNPDKPVKVADFLQSFFKIISEIDIKANRTVAFLDNSVQYLIQFIDNNKELDSSHKEAVQDSVELVIAKSLGLNIPLSLLNENKEERISVAQESIRKLTNNFSISGSLEYELNTVYNKRINELAEYQKEVEIFNKVISPDLEVLKSIIMNNVDSDYATLETSINNFFAERNIDSKNLIGMTVSLVVSTANLSKDKEIKLLDNIAQYTINIVKSGEVNATYESEISNSIYSSVDKALNFIIYPNFKVEDFNKSISIAKSKNEKIQKGEYSNEFKRIVNESFELYSQSLQTHKTELEQQQQQQQQQQEQQQEQEQQEQPKLDIIIKTINSSIDPSILAKRQILAKKIYGADFIDYKKSEKDIKESFKKENNNGIKRKDELEALELLKVYCSLPIEQINFKVTDEMEVRHFLKYTDFILQYAEKNLKRKEVEVVFKQVAKIIDTLQEPQKMALVDIMSHSEDFTKKTRATHFNLYKNMDMKALPKEYRFGNSVTKKEILVDIVKTQEISDKAFNYFFNPEASGIDFVNKTFKDENDFITTPIHVKNPDGTTTEFNYSEIIRKRILALKFIGKGYLTDIPKTIDGYAGNPRVIPANFVESIAKENEQINNFLKTQYAKLDEIVASTNLSIAEKEKQFTNLRNNLEIMQKSFKNEINKYFAPNKVLKDMITFEITPQKQKELNQKAIILYRDALLEQNRDKLNEIDNEVNELAKVDVSRLSTVEKYTFFQKVNVASSKREGVSLYVERKLKKRYPNIYKSVDSIQVNTAFSTIFIPLNETLENIIDKFKEDFNESSKSMMHGYGAAPTVGIDTSINTSSSNIEELMRREEEFLKNAPELELIYALLNSPYNAQCAVPQVIFHTNGVAIMPDHNSVLFDKDVKTKTNEKYPHNNSIHLPTLCEGYESFEDMKAQAQEYHRKREEIDAKIKVGTATKEEIKQNDAFHKIERQIDTYETYLQYHENGKYVLRPGLDSAKFNELRERMEAISVLNLLDENLEHFKMSRDYYRMLDEIYAEHYKEEENGEENAFHTSILKIGRFKGKNNRYYVYHDEVNKYYNSFDDLVALKEEINTLKQENSENPRITQLENDYNLKKQAVLKTLNRPLERTESEETFRLKAEVALNDTEPEMKKLLQEILNERTNVSNELSNQIKDSIQNPEVTLSKKYKPEFSPEPEDKSRYINLEDKNTIEDVQTEINKVLIAEKDNKKRNIAIDAYSNGFVKIFDKVLNDEEIDINEYASLDSQKFENSIRNFVMGGFYGDPSAIQEVFNSTYNKLENIIANAPPEKAERLKEVLKMFEEGEKRAMTVHTKGLLKQNQSYYEPVKDSLLKNNDSINHLIETFKSNGNNINANISQSLKDQLNSILGEEGTLRETATALSKIYTALNNIPDLSPESQMAKDILNTIQETIATRYPDPLTQSKLYLMASSYAKKQLSKSKVPVLTSQLTNKFIESSLENVSFKVVNEINKDESPKYTMNHSQKDAMLDFAKQNREFISSFDPSLTDTFTKSFGKALYKVDKLVIGTPTTILLDLTEDSKSFVKEADAIIDLSIDVLRDKTLLFEDKCAILQGRTKEFLTNLDSSSKSQEIKSNFLSNGLTELSKVAPRDENGEITLESKEAIRNFIGDFQQHMTVSLIPNAIIQFVFSEQDNNKSIKNISLISSVLKNDVRIQPIIKQEIMETLYNKVLSSGNLKQIECLLERLPSMTPMITKDRKDIIEDVLISLNKNKIIEILASNATKQESKNDIIDILLEPTKINPAIAKSKDYLNKINQVLEETLPSLILNTELPLDKVFKLNPKLANNEYTFKAICVSNKTSFKDFKLISDKRTLKEDEIMNFILKTPDRIKDVEKQKEEVLQTLKLISKRKGLSKPISKLREEDIKKLADLFAKNPNIFTDEIKTTLKNNLDTRLFNTFNNELQQQRTQQNNDQPQHQPVVLGKQTKLQENRERQQGQTNSNGL
jgi:hypothetical protein